MNPIFVSLIFSLGKFKIKFYTTLIKLISIFFILIIFFLTVGQLTPIQLSIIEMISFSIPFVFDVIFVYYYLNKLKSEEKKKLSFRFVLERILKYGSWISGMNVGSTIWTELKKLLIVPFGSSELVTGYNVGKRYSEVGGITISGLDAPLMISMTKLNAKNKSKQINRIYNIIYRYSSFILFLVTGLLFFFSEFFLILLRASYLKYDLIVKLILFTLILNPLHILFYAALKAQNKTKLMMIIELGFLTCRIVVYTLGIMLFNIYGAILGLIISNFFSFFILLSLHKRIIKIKLNYSKIFVQLISFFIPLVFTLFLDRLIFVHLNILISGFIGLEFFQYLNIFSLGCFSLSYLCINIFLKVLTKNDVDNIVSLFQRESISHRFIRYTAKHLKKILYK
jgi:O-antigen/teichoic acid export membrane protein